ncbi:hypothetical protein BGX26_005661 [Mortierella sp. AD094]|nr:hypothetical protein BGX26_005661 [Mortierella sp. AD094]
MDALGVQFTLSETAILARIKALRDEDSNIGNSAAGALLTLPILSHLTIEAILYKSELNVHSSTIDDFEDEDHNPFDDSEDEDHSSTFNEFRYSEGLEDLILGNYSTLSGSTIEALCFTAQSIKYQDCNSEALGQSILPESLVQALVSTLSEEEIYVRASVTTVSCAQAALNHHQALIYLLQREANGD